MKKTMILILVVLPLFLMIIINLSGRIISHLKYIPVENIEISYINNNSEKTKLDNLTIGLEDFLEFIVDVTPSIATNKEYDIEIKNPNLFDIKDNKIIPKDYGTTTIIIKAKDNNTKKEIKITIKDETVKGIEINTGIYNEELDKIILDVNKGESHKINYSILPYTAINKSVNFKVSDEDLIKVDSLGNINIIGYPDENYEKDIYIDIKSKGNESIYKRLYINIIGNTPLLGHTDYLDKLITIESNLVDLSQYFSFDQSKISLEDLNFNITQGSSFSRIKDLSYFETDKLGNYMVEISLKENENIKIKLMFRRTK